MHQIDVQSPPRPDFDKIGIALVNQPAEVGCRQRGPRSHGQPRDFQPVADGTGHIFANAEPICNAFIKQRLGGIDETPKPFVKPAFPNRKCFVSAKFHDLPYWPENRLSLKSPIRSCSHKRAICATASSTSAIVLNAEKLNRMLAYASASERPIARNTYEGSGC